MQRRAAKGLDAGKVGQHIVRVVHGLVHFEEMGVAVDKQHLALELGGLFG